MHRPIQESLWISIPIFLDGSAVSSNISNMSAKQARKPSKPTKVDLVDLYRILKSERLVLAGSHGTIYYALRRYLHTLSEQLSHPDQKGNIKTIKASSIGRKLAAVRSFVKFLVKQGIFDFNAALLLKNPKAEMNLPIDYCELGMADVLSKKNEDVAEPLAPLSVRDRAVLELLYSSGLRRSELCSIDLSELDLKARTVRVLGKGSKQRIVPIGTKAAEAIKKNILQKETLPFLELPRLSKAGGWVVETSGHSFS